jgi:hypothetical protein
LNASIPVLPPWLPKSNACTFHASSFIFLILCD